MRSRTIWLAVLALGANVATPAAPQKATFSGETATVQWPLADLDPGLPADWKDFDFLVLEFRASGSQRFELGLVEDAGSISRRIHPLANVWVRAAIPLRFFRAANGDAAANQPRNSYWISLEGGEAGALERVRAISLTMRHPVKTSTIELRRIGLSKTDPGDAVLEGGSPIIDDFGQYMHADWPGKARNSTELVREWSAEQRMMAPRAGVAACRHGGFAAGRRQATGFFRVEKIDDRWWLVDPEGCRFWSAGVDGPGLEPPRTEIVGRSKLFAAIPTRAQLPAPDATADPLRDPVSFYLANLERRFGENWQAPSAQLAARRMRAWGLNTVVGAGLDETLAATPTLRQAYVLPLRGWQSLEGAIMGMPDVYSTAFAQRVAREAGQQLGARRDDPWMLGYFIGDEPAWVGREGELVDRVLAGPPGPLQQRFKTELARGDTPPIRRQLVHAAFARYLEIVDAAVRRAAPHHLNLGIRFAAAPSDDLLALARGFDVISMNLYRWAPPKDFIDRVQAMTKLPVLIAGFHFGVPERGLAAGQVQTLSQPERGVAYSYYVEHAAEHPAIIGTIWNQWIDQPATGRRDGENYNIGWIDVTDRPYPELVAAAKATHARVEALHAGRLAATTRRARASESGTPDDPR